MADRPYSIHAPDEPTITSYMNYEYNLAQQRPQTFHYSQQQKQHALYTAAAVGTTNRISSSMGTTIRELDATNRSSFYLTSTSCMTDFNNNNKNISAQVPTTSNSWCNYNRLCVASNNNVATNSNQIMNSNSNIPNINNCGPACGTSVSSISVGGASMIVMPKINYTNNNRCCGSFTPSIGNGDRSFTSSLLFSPMGIASIVDDITAQDGSVASAPYTSIGVSHQYVPITNSSATYYNRNRYMPYPYTNNFRSTIAAATATSSTVPSSVFMPNTNNNITIGKQSFQQISLQPLTAYNEDTTNDVGSSNATTLTNNYTIVNMKKEDITDTDINTTAVTDFGKDCDLNSSTKSKEFPTAKTTNGSLDTNNSTDNKPYSTTTIKTTIKTPSSFDMCMSDAKISATIPQSAGSLDKKSTNTNMNSNTKSNINLNNSISNTNTSAMKDISQIVTLQITNLDYTMDESSLHNFLMGQLNPITPVISLIFEGSSYAKVTVPDLYFAKQVVSNLHRKKIGHKRMLVSYTRDSSLTEINTLRCQVAGLLKDVPYYTLPMYKFRELFQSRFKTSISVLDLYKMPDICTINTDSNEEKVIGLRPELIDSLDTSPLIEGLQHSVPYCTTHFKREQHKGWAEQEIEPLPNICMTISELQKIIYPLLNAHPGDIPIATLLHCIEGQLNIQLTPNESGVNLEHLVCCIQGIQIQVNNFGIKILGWIEVEKNCKEKLNCSSSSNNNNNITTNSNSSNASSNNTHNTNTTTAITTPSSVTGISQTSNDRGNNSYGKNYIADSLYLISREVIELIKMSPKSTMKFNRFIPAYHNHFGKQCRVADYGYTKLIELFEALSTVVQIMGDGENRQITLTHRTQVRRFTSDLLRVLRAHGNKSVLLSQLPTIFTQTQYRMFDITDYGVCDIIDILDGLVHSNIVVVSAVQQGKDILISMPRRKQTAVELEKTSVFAGEMIELFSTAPQYAILFQKFVRSYHYHFAYQCRLSDYGFLKLADLMEAIQGIVELELNNDEDRKIYLSTHVAQRIFAEQCEELIRCATGSTKTCMKFSEVLELHKKKFGYQIQAQTMGVQCLEDAIEILPNIEVLEREADSTEYYIICHNEDALFRTLSYRAIKYLLHFNQHHVTPQINLTQPIQQQLKKVPIVLKETERVVVGGAAVERIPLNHFIQQFNKQHNETLSVRQLNAMRHFFEIYNDSHQPTQQLVRLSSFSKFLLSIVQCLEQRTNIILHDLKQILDCQLGSTFQFGYPNLFSVLTAYPDLFAVNINLMQSRSEITLLNTCELRTTTTTMSSAGTADLKHIYHHNTYGGARVASGSVVNKLKSTLRNARAAFGDCNNNNNSTNGNGTDLSQHQQSGPTPAKTRAVAMAGHETPLSNICSTSSLSYAASDVASNFPFRYPVYTPPLQSAPNDNRNNNNSFAINTEANKQIRVTNANDYHANAMMHLGNKHTFQSSVSTMQQHSTRFPNNSISNKENSFDTSLSMMNASLSLSETSLSSSFLSSTINCSSLLADANCSIDTTNMSSNSNGNSIDSSLSQKAIQQQNAILTNTTKLWNRRRLSSTERQIIQQQSSQPQLTMFNKSLTFNQEMVKSHPNGEITTSSIPVNQQLGFYEFIHNVHDKCSQLEPPKPDTPPSMNMPFWIDPIWAHNVQSAEHRSQHELLNIKLPEMKIFNVLPMVLSPYTLSKNENMKQLFNFENHDRKIA